MTDICDRLNMDEITGVSKRKTEIIRKTSTDFNNLYEMCKNSGDIHKICGPLIKDVIKTFKVHPFKNDIYPREPYSLNPHVERLKDKKLMLEMDARKCKDPFELENIQKQIKLYESVIKHFNIRETYMKVITLHVGQPLKISERNDKVRILKFI